MNKAVYILGENLIKFDNGYIGIGDYVKSVGIKNWYYNPDDEDIYQSYETGQPGHVLRFATRNLQLNGVPLLDIDLDTIDSNKLSNSFWEINKLKYNLDNIQESILKSLFINGFKKGFESAKEIYDIKEDINQITLEYNEHGKNKELVIIEGKVVIKEIK